MTTLATLKSAIADDLARSDLTTQIAAAISQAIDDYKSERLFWNETRDETFTTVAAQSTYDVDDDAAIPLFLTIDAMWIEDSDSRRYALSPCDPIAMEGMLDSSAASGRPYAYSYFNQSFRFYPIPDAVFTVRPMGQIEVTAPSSDAETGNLWMTKAFELLRCAAKALLFIHTIKDPEQALAMELVAQRQLAKLRRETGARTATGTIVSTLF